MLWVLQKKYYSEYENVFMEYSAFLDQKFVHEENIIHGQTEKSFLMILKTMQREKFPFSSCTYTKNHKP